jgi:hypothetical protein
MPALIGQIIMTLTKADGSVALRIFINYDDTDPARALMARTVDTTDGPRTGALIVDNQTDQAIRMVLADPDGGPEREVRIPKTGAALTVAQCAAQGYTTQTDFNGLTIDWAG